MPPEEINSSVGFFDTHFHLLHILKKEPAAQELLKKTALYGIDAAVDEHDFDRRLAYTADLEHIGLAAGIHPLSAAEGFDLQRFDIIKQQAGHPKIAAVGETGLDFFRGSASCRNQQDAFDSHLNLAAETGLPVIIHNRSADKQILEMIRCSPCRKGVFHCFSSEWETAEKALNLGFYISFAGNLTYKKNQFIRDAASRVPADRLLIETDAPYLPPQRVRGQVNHPVNVKYTFQVLSEIRPEKSLKSILFDNSMKLFAIAGPECQA